MGIGQKRVNLKTVLYVHAKTNLKWVLSENCLFCLFVLGFPKEELNKSSYLSNNVDVLKLRRFGNKIKDSVSCNQSSIVVEVIRTVLFFLQKIF